MYGIGFNPHLASNKQKFNKKDCLVPFFPQKILDFGSLFCKMDLNTNAKFLTKRWLFSILDFDLMRRKNTKKSLKRLS